MRAGTLNWGDYLDEYIMTDMTVIIAAKGQDSVVVAADSLAIVRNSQKEVVNRDEHYQKLFFIRPEFAVMVAGVMIGEHFTKKFIGNFSTYAKDNGIPSGEALCRAFGEYAKSNFRFDHPDGNVEFLVAGYEKHEPFICRISSLAFNGNPPYWVGFCQNDYLTCGTPDYPEQLMEEYNLHRELPAKSVRNILRRVLRETREKYPNVCGGDLIIKILPNH